MSDLAAKIRATVLQVKKSLGTLVTSAVISTTTQGAYDPATGLSATSETVSPCGVVVTKFEQSEINGTSIMYSDLKVLMFNEGIEPTTKDEITISGSRFEILSVTPDYVGDIPAIYVLHCRK